MRGVPLFGYWWLLVQELLLMLTTAALCRSLLAAGSYTDYLLLNFIPPLTSGG